MNTRALTDERVEAKVEQMEWAICNFPSKTGIGPDDMNKDMMLRIPREAVHELGTLACIICFQTQSHNLKEFHGPNKSNNNQNQQKQ